MSGSVEQIIWFDVSAEPHNSGGKELWDQGPRGFIAGLERYAQAKVQLQSKFDRIERESGRSRVEMNSRALQLGKYMDITAKSFDGALVETFTVGKEGVSEAQKDLLDNLLASIQWRIFAKRWLITEEQNKYNQEIGASHHYIGLKPDDNKAVAARIYQRMFPEQSVPLGIMYSETPLGIAFVLPKGSETELAKRRSLLLGNKEGSWAHTDKATKAFAGKRTIPYEDSEVTIAYSMLVATHDVQGDNVLVRNPTYVHENQHILDSVLDWAGLDATRFSKLFSSEKRRARVGVELTESSWDFLKTEVYAHEYTRFVTHRATGLNPIVPADDVLTNSSTLYNLEGALDRKFVELPSDDGIVDRIVKKWEKVLVHVGLKRDMKGSESHKYRMIVQESLGSLRSLERYYLQVFDDPEDAYRMAVAMLDSFPVVDWPTIDKAVRRYATLDS